ncbi:MAG TPA: ThuA domain-containing protein [Cyclobacteriaceae bacterium]
MHAKTFIIAFILLKVCFAFSTCFAQARKKTKPFHVIAFFTAKNDQAHISFVHQANKWFPSVATKNNFTYDTTSNWNNLNEKFLSNYQVVLFLDTRPEAPEQREAFKKYMENGGAWMGFHFAAFALTPSDYPQNWDWYHEEFIGAGQFKSNTWRPTSALLRVEAPSHPSMAGLPQTLKTAPNEWYRWENDLKKNSNITILLSIDTTSFPLGTGPKPDEIWHEGYCPVVWTNTKYKMIYVNMGHNDIDYEHGTNKELSNSFDSDVQNKFLITSLQWLGDGKSKPSMKKK